MGYRRLIVVTAAMILGGITLVIVRPPEHAVAASVTTPPQQVVAFIDAVHDLSPPLRDLVPASTVTPAPAGAALDMIQSLNHTGLNVVQSFDGIVTPGGSMGTWASDANADVGHDHVMEATNFSAAIYAKDGSVVMAPFATSTFWSGFSAPCGGGWSDVVVLYDQEADRWFVSRFARQNTTSPLNWFQCFAISQTADPTGNYYRYAFLMDVEEFNDYPKFGIWPDGYYMTADRDKIFPGLGNFVAAFEREQMLAGLPAQGIIMKIDNNGNRAGMLPADWDGDTPPPDGSPGWFVKTIDDNTGWSSDALEIWSLQVDWTAGTGVMSLVDTLTPAAFDSAVCDLDQDCITQPDTSNGLDPLAGGRPMFRLAYRNQGTHEAMVFNHTVESAEDQAAVRWYELRRNGGPWSIYQENTLSPDDDHRWIGSMAMDLFGNAALVYNVSGEAIYPSIVLAARLPGDPLGTIEEEATLMAGSGSQTGFIFWADYSSLTLDPADDCTFWSAATYQPSTTSLQGWATRLSAFRFPDCLTDLAVKKSAAPASPIEAGTDVTWSLEVSNNGPAGAGNVGLSDNVPAGTGFQSLDADTDWVCTTPSVGGTGNVLCDRDKLDAGATTTIEVEALINCSTADGTLIGNSVSVIADTPPDSDVNNNNDSTTFTVDNPVPVITASITVDQLTQNPHNLVVVGLQASATDGPCPAPSLAVTVYSDEDDEEHGSSGQFSPDAKEIAPETLRLRVERVGMNDGRVYLIVITATDEGGGTGFGTLTVTVPKSSSPSDLAAVEAEAATAKAFADANDGQPPPGYFLVGDGPEIGPKQ